MTPQEHFEAAAVRWVATHACATQQQYRAAMNALRAEHGVSEVDGAVVVNSKAYGPRRRPVRAGGAK